MLMWVHHTNSDDSTDMSDRRLFLPGAFYSSHILLSGFTGLGLFRIEKHFLLFSWKGTHV